MSEGFTNQKQLEVEAKNLQTQSAKYAKQTSQWLSMIDSFNNALKVRERARPSLHTGPCAPARANTPSVRTDPTLRFGPTSPTLRFGPSSPCPADPFSFVPT